MAALPYRRVRLHPLRNLPERELQGQDSLRHRHCSTLGRRMDHLFRHARELQHPAPAVPAVQSFLRGSSHAHFHGNLRILILITEYTMSIRTKLMRQLMSIILLYNVRRTILKQ